MVWNHALHLIIGVLGTNIMTWSASGVLVSMTFALISQTINMVRMYIYHRNRISAEPEDVRELHMMNFKQRALYKYAQLYVAKVLWYGFVTLVAAQIVRSFGV